MNRHAPNEIIAAFLPQRWPDPQMTREIAYLANMLEKQRLGSSADTVTQFFSRQIPERLWHYTTMDGLEGLLESGKIWATDARFTTDSSEFKHIAVHAEAYLQARHCSSEEERTATNRAGQLVAYEFEHGALAESTTQVFVASFSEAQDCKSQWLGYAANGRGVSIAFDLRKVRPPSQLLTAITLAPCIYDQVTVHSLLEVCLNHFILTAAQLSRKAGDREWMTLQRQWWRQIADTFGEFHDDSNCLELMLKEFEVELRASRVMTAFDLLRLASHCKNPYFSEEREWRLALPRTVSRPVTNLEIRHRGADGNVPYICSDLFSRGRLPITEIMLGAAANTDEAVSLLDRFGYSVPLSRSASPERTL